MKNPFTTVVGYGRFGELWADFLRRDFDVAVVDPDQAACERARINGLKVVGPEQGVLRDVIFYAVPISSFETVLRNHLPWLDVQSPRLVIDLLSVKLHAEKILRELLPAHVESILTHPMFGPDSVSRQGLEGLPIMCCPLRVADARYRFWTGYFSARGLRVQEMSADEHDRLAARSQGVTHFVGRILGELGMEPTPIDTLGTKKLFEIREQVCNDSWQLFTDIQTYNPRTLEMRVALGTAQAKVFNRLLPNRVHTDRLVVGIQGGRGSFNEQAAHEYLARADVKEFELRYLHRTEQVLRALNEGEVDRGQFALHNSAGGIVEESVETMSRYNFRIVEEYAIKIEHCLMIHPESSLGEITVIMTHSQVLRQCAKNLSRKYATLKLSSGEGDLLDHAKVAEHLISGKLPRTVATMGSRKLAELHGLTIVEENLQDLDNNLTSFLWVERPA